MREWIEKVMATKPVAHLIKAGTRFGERNGPLFAASITYFTVLSIVPVLMFTFAMVGLFVTALRPDLLQTAKAMIIEALGTPSEGVTNLIDQFFSGLSGFGITTLVSLGIALWTGTGWTGNLRRAIQFQVADDPLENRPTRNPVLEILVNMGTFVVFILLMLATITITVLTTSFNEQVVEWLGLSSTPGVRFLVSLIALALTACAMAVLFLYLYWVLSGRRLPMREWILGSLAAGVFVSLLQSFAGLVTGMFSNNMSASIFGPVIVLMLFLNLYATVVMFVASWIGTADHPADPMAASVPIMPERQAEPETRYVRLGPVPARSQGLVITPENVGEFPGPDPDVLIPQDVAARGVKVGAAAGYGLGIVTGVGLGAFVAGLFKRRPKA